MTEAKHTKRQTTKEGEDRAFEALLVSALRGGDIDIDSLPELTEKDKAALDSLGPDFIRRLIAKVEVAELQASHAALLEACKEALGLPGICEEIGYAGEHHCMTDGHAMIKTRDGKYIKMHCQGGFPARDRIVAMIRSAVAKAEVLNE